MSSPYSITDAGFREGTSTSFAFDGADDSDPDIPRRVMRVKVLYTFDNDNKTHCLARLVRPVPIQVVALDETTEIGVVELRTCIQAIVAASPEMIAKLENDYTVYAYDYSEYETPLVGQGMLSWVLATASPTPNAPARDSGTMVTGRVCKNIMGLFSSGGIKETLEVKLKLVPVPTRSKREYLQSMAVYRDPNVVMPDGFDNNAWNSFLQAIPDAGALRDGSAGQTNVRANVGGVEQLHSMLTPKFGPEDDTYSNGPGSSRAGSPTPSHQSMSNRPAAYHGSRPGSRASFHQQQTAESAIDDQGFDDGPAKKRARLMQTDWHGRASFGANAASLRSAVTTAASIRDFRPSAAGHSSAGGDMIPRAPTPRPGEKRSGRPGMPRAGSSLRRESTDRISPYALPEPELTRNDSGIYSNEYDGGSSRHGSPSPELPSSPPEYTPIEPPSSPLPELPLVPDSGFQSDLPNVNETKSSNMKPPVNSHLARKARGVIEFAHIQPGPQANLPTSSFPNFDPLSQKSAMSAKWSQTPTSPNMRPAHRRGGRAPSKAAPEPPSRQTSATPLPMSATSPDMHQPMQSIETSFPPTPIEAQEQKPLPPFFNSQQMIEQIHAPKPRPAPPHMGHAPSSPHIAAAPGASAISTVPLNDLRQTQSQGPTLSNYVLEPRRNDAPQIGGQKAGRAPRRALKKAQSWAAADSSDVESDNGLGQVAAANKKSRSKGGSGLVRSTSIHNQLAAAVASGAPVRFCCNCGEIKTPTWRPYWLKVFDGDAQNITVGVGSGVHMLEILERDEDGKTTKYRVFKQYGHLTQAERDAKLYEQTYFCNPCGDYIRKWGKFRPRELWDPSIVQTQTKNKKGPRKKKGAADLLTSDLPMPSSEWDMPTPFSEIPMFTDPFGPSEAQYDMPPSDFNQHNGAPMYLPQTNGEAQQQRPSATPSQQVPLNNFQPPNANADHVALQKAIQSSPARNLAAQENTAQADKEILTPKPTRRLLFPSPRKDGEFKSLDSVPASKSGTNSPEASCSKPNSRPQHTNQEPHQSQDSTSTSAPKTQTSTEGSLDIDKENLPPPMNDDDEFAHLFEEGIFQTPQKLKTPSKAVPRTPNSRGQNAFLSTGLTPRTGAPNTGLTPKTGSKRSSECMGPPDTPTPTKRRSPRLAEKHQQTSKEMTPFTKSLNQFLSDGLTSSPSKVFNWTLTSSPAKNLSSTFGDMAAISRLTAGKQNLAVPPSDDNLWSDFPMPSSPPFFSQHKATEAGGGAGGFEDYDWGGLLGGAAGAMAVDVWEDGTATDPVKGWETVFEEEEEKAMAVACGETTVADAAAS